MTPRRCWCQRLKLKLAKAFANTSLLTPLCAVNSAALEAMMKLLIVNHRTQLSS